MMNKHKNTRLGEEIKQIKILLGDFKKARSKCLELASSLQMDITKDNFYPNTERTTLMKCELLDLQGLVQLKNSLVKVLGELFDNEREYVYQLEKREAQHNLRLESRVKEAEPVVSTPAVESGWEKKDGPMESMRSSRTSELRMSRKVEVPFYKIDQEVVESVETKLDRISKFIASLKKSIKGATQTASCKFKTKDFLLQQEVYVKAKAELERYLMREQELEKIVSRVVKKQVQQHFATQAILSPEGEYYLIKVPRPKPQPSQERISQPTSPNKKISTPGQEKTSPIQPSPSVIQKLAHVQAQAEADFQQIKVELQRKTQNYAELFSQMNEAVEKGNQKLSELRQKRKQAFQKDDELWDEL